MKIIDLRATTERTAAEFTAEVNALLRQPRPDPSAVNPLRTVERAAHLREGGRRPSRTEFERMIGGNDLVDLNYLMRGLTAARPVCRIQLRDAAGRAIGCATGFKVSPGLMLTNAHVFPDAAEAGRARIEFDYELDVAGDPRPTTTFALAPEVFFWASEAVDAALVAIRPQPLLGSASLDTFGFLRLNPDLAKINEGEFVTIIQHPSGLPKQVALRENVLLKIETEKLIYQSDTAQGSSGAPLMNDSWQVVGLHSTGVPRKNEAGDWLTKRGEVATEEDDDADIDWTANAGIRASVLFRAIEQNAPDHPLKTAFLDLSRRDVAIESLTIPAEQPVTPRPPAPISSVPISLVQGVAIQPITGGAQVTVPLTFTVSFGGAPPPPAPPGIVAGGEEAPERWVEPWRDTTYATRLGYQPDFLGVPVPLPDVLDESVLSRMQDGATVVPYANFSLAMHARRRLAVFTASNVDHRRERQEPEADKSYTRLALTGLSKNDRERWFLDPRLPAAHQLPDKFFSEDSGAFDKGHIVRREDVCWGDTYRDVRIANGDTYHVTNCSPQVAGFNQKSKGGIWGALEDYVKAQSAAEQLNVFAGPILHESDPWFSGRDAQGPARVQIPLAFWKVVVARGQDGALQAFGFKLDQDLGDVPLEFAVDAIWRRKMIAIEELGALIGLRFAPAVMAADQFVATAPDL